MTILTWKGVRQRGDGFGVCRGGPCVFNLGADEGEERTEAALEKVFRAPPSRRCCWHTFCYSRLRRLMALVFVKEMDDAEFVKVIPVVLFIIEKLSRPVKKIPAPRIRFFGLLVQLFGGNTFRPDSTAVACKELSNVIYKRGRAPEAPT